jgi:aryl-alcohol dehydrogenase-like predicted oxidoreductase
VTASELPARVLGSSGLSVSVVSLGSWRTYERIPREQALAVMRAARDAGITFLDDARYDDETGRAPMRTGWSEVVFGELFRAAGWVRDEVVVANKLWWEFWPDQHAAAELEASLGRMGLDHVDLIYSMPPPDSLPLAEALAQVVGLVASGKAQAWGIGNWPGSLLADAVEVCRAEGWPLPCAAQLPYSLVRRDWVEDEPMAGLLASGDTSLVASYSLAGGVLSGKYLRGESGRAGDGSSLTQGDAAAARQLDELAGEWGVPAAQLALAFALRHPHSASVLFGATTPEQLRQNVGVIEVAGSLDDSQWRRLRSVGA